MPKVSMISLPSDMVTLVEVDHLRAHQCEVIENASHFLLILGCDVGFAEGHEVFKVIIGIVDEAADSRIGNLVLHEGNGTHVKFDEFGNILHLRSLGQTHPAEDAGYHFRSDEIMVVESPAEFVVPTFGDGFGDVVHQRTPP